MNSSDFLEQIDLFLEDVDLEEKDKISDKLEDLKFNEIILKHVTKNLKLMH